MARKPPVEKRPANRPLIPIDWKKANELMISGCMGTEVASFFGMSPDTFYRRVEDEFGVTFTQYLQEKRETGNSLLRTKQYQKAMSGDNTLLVWLGKCRLKQRENDDRELSVKEQTIEDTLQRAKLKAENIELRKLLIESQARNVDLQSQQATEHLVRGGEIGEDLQ